MAVAYALHVLFAVLWVGGMFFAYLCLRPALAELDAKTRAGIWVRVLGRFFTVVLVAIPVMLLTGLYLIFLYGGFAKVGMHIHLMFGLGLLMMLLFLHVFFAPFKRLKRAFEAGDTDTATRQIGQIRKLVGVNLTLGVLVVLIATAGRFGLGT